MHSASSRTNSILIYTGMVLAAMCILNYLHGVYLYEAKADVHFEVVGISTFTKTEILGDGLLFHYNLEADLSQLYNWNLKQLFVYIEAEWTHPKSQLKSRSIICDWILEAPADRSDVEKVFRISEESKTIKYPLRDIHSGLRNATVKLSLNVEYMPVVGYFFKSRLFESNLTLPAAYTK